MRAAPWSGTGRRRSTTGPPPGIRPCGSGSRSATASIWPRDRLQRFAPVVQLRRAPVRRTRRTRLRRGALLRPLAQHPWQARSGRAGDPACDEGLDVDALEEALGAVEGPSLVYTIPTFQNPSGRTLRSRAAAVARARPEHGAVIFEDDPYGLLRFEGGAPAKALRARRRRGRHLSLLVLEDGCSGDPRRLRRAPGGARDVRRGSDPRELRLAGGVRAGRALRVPPPRPLRTQRRGDSPRPAGEARRDACRPRARDARRHAVERARRRVLPVGRPPAGVRGDDLLGAATRSA